MVTSDQGTPNSLANAWPVKLTDGYGNLSGEPNNPVVVKVDGYVQTNPHIIVDGYVQTNPNVVVTNFPSSQPVSGTITSNQGSPNVLTNAWPVEVTDGYGNILGTSNNPIIVSSGAVVRTTRVFTAINFVGVGNTETMITLTPYSGYVAGSTGTSFGVSSGKTLRIQSIVINTVTGSGSGPFSLRISSNGSVTTSTPVIIPLFCMDNSSQNTAPFILPEGLELTGSMQFGISQINTNAALSYNVSIIGYEY